MKSAVYGGENDYPLLTWKLLERTHSKYLSEEPRDAIYKTSLKLIEDNWNDLTELSNSLGFLMLTWNSAFYRYGSFDYDLIQKCLVKNKGKLDNFRQREILSLKNNEKEEIGRIYKDLLHSLAAKGRNGGKNEGKVAYSPVSVAKALHLLCPGFFPLWDNSIAETYGCKWGSADTSFENYWQFMMKSLMQVTNLSEQKNLPITLRNSGILKLIDEYNCILFATEHKSDKHRS